jgi:hypothetical protein
MTRKRRRLLLLSVAAGFVAVGLGLAFGLHWKAYGWWKGEPFYRGLPASYYARRIRASFPPNATQQPLEFRRPSPAERFARQHLPARMADVVWPAPPFWDADRPDPSVLPVLLQLMKNPDARVRGWAALAVFWMKKEREKGVPALIAMLDDPDEYVRCQVLSVLQRLGPAARPAVPRLLELRGDPSKASRLANGYVPYYAGTALRAIDPDVARP